MLNSPGCGLALAADELTPEAGNGWCPGATEEIGGVRGGGIPPKGPLRPVRVPAGVDPPEPKPDEGCGLEVTLPCCFRKLNTGKGGGAGASAGRGGTTNRTTPG